MKKKYPKKVIDYIKKFKLDKLLGFTNFEVKNYGLYDTVSPNNPIPFKIDWYDVYYLHNTIIKEKVINVIDIGLGHSTIVMADALRRNKKKYNSFVKKNIRKSDPFVVYSIDASHQWVKEFKLRDDYKMLKEYINVSYSDVKTGTFNDRICSYYSNFPNIAADLIYVDAPGMYDIKGSLDGTSFHNVERVPLAADLLRIEYLLTPGTIIIVDGRFSNSRFLKNNFQREWSYKENMSYDFSEFRLIEKPIGRFNKIQNQFRKK